MIEAWTYKGFNVFLFMAIFTAQNEREETPGISLF